MSKTIKLTLGDQLAAKYERLSQPEKDKITAVIEDLLKADYTLESTMDDMSRKAQAAGLTVEELNRLLDE